MANQGTSKNIVYLDYSNSAIDSGSALDTVKPDAVANLIKNAIITFEKVHEPEPHQGRIEEEPKKLE